MRCQRVSMQSNQEQKNENNQPFNFILNTRIEGLIMISNRHIMLFAGVMLCLMALPSVTIQSKVKISNTLLYYVCAYSIIGVSLYSLIRNKLYKEPVYICIFIYLIWAVICIVRGVFMIKTYWVMNQFIRGTMYTLVPISVFLFAKPTNCIVTLRLLNRFLPVMALLLFGWALPLSAYPYFLCPFFIVYICFFDAMSTEWKWITIMVFIAIALALDNRSGLLKEMFTLMVFIASMFPVIIRNIAFNAMHWIPYAIAITLLTLGLTGNYNIFDPTMNDISRYVTVTYNTISDDKEDDDYTQDTRTFIYVESITSAFDNDHLWTGRTPARGYSSPHFFYLDGKAEGATGIDDDERFASEVGHVNIFIWDGIIGVILVTIMYLFGSFIALYHSRNIYIKMMGIILAFHWAFGWIENPYMFQILDMTLFFLMALCYSPEFRQMSDTEFRLFIQDIFAKPSDISKLELLKLVRLDLTMRAMLKRNSVIKKPIIGN